MRSLDNCEFVFWYFFISRWLCLLWSIHHPSLAGLMYLVDISHLCLFYWSLNYLLSQFLSSLFSKKIQAGQRVSHEVVWRWWEVECKMVDITITLMLHSPRPDGLQVRGNTTRTVIRIDTKHTICFLASKVYRKTLWDRVALIYLVELLISFIKN